LLDSVLADVLAIDLKEIERTQQHRIILPSVANQIEYRQPVLIDGYRLAVNNA
jgi:hypothetical protein